jgi:LmbE family N-acetylglucosaminyl deacetylase
MATGNRETSPAANVLGWKPHMNTLRFSNCRTLLCLGAHSDDIEIGCGGTLLRLAAEHPGLEVHWIVFSGRGDRRAEAADSARQFLAEAGSTHVCIHEFRDSYFPAQYEALKGEFHELAASIAPDMIFTHRRDDAHQDHRVLAELTWCTFRNHPILEYEIPKYEGDLDHPNLYVPLDAATARRKAELIFDSFPTQRGKPWFTADTFLALMRIRGVECNAPAGYAEGFCCRKLVV